MKRLLKLAVVLLTLIPAVAQASNRLLWNGLTESPVAGGSARLHYGSSTRLLQNPKDPGVPPEQETCGIISTVKKEPNVDALAFDANDQLFVSEVIMPNGVYGGEVIKKLNNQIGEFEWIAGDLNGEKPACGMPFTSVSTTQSRFDSVGGMAFAPSGQLYVSDSYCNRIFKIDLAAKMVIPVAGTGESGFSGDGGLAVNAILSGPSSFDFDAEGNLYFADYKNHRIREIDTAGKISTVVETSQLGSSVWKDKNYQAFFHNVVVKKDGDLLIGVEWQSQSLAPLEAFTVEKFGMQKKEFEHLAGTFWNVDPNNQYIGEYGPAQDAHMGFISGMLLDQEGSLYLSQLSWPVKIFKIDAKSGYIFPVAGPPAGNGTPNVENDGMVADGAPIGWISRMAMNSKGDLYLLDQNRIQKVSCAASRVYNYKP